MENHMSDLTKKIRLNMERYPSCDPNDFTSADEIEALLLEVEALEKKIKHLNQTQSPNIVESNV